MVGHCIQVDENQIIPADMILIATKNNNCVFLDMSKILGVLKLPEKKPVAKLSKTINLIENDPNKMLKINGKFKISEPSSDYNNFFGTFKPNDNPSAVDVYVSNILFTGAVLKGCGPVIGFVVYCGNESRIQLNTDHYKRKTSRIEWIINI